MAVREKIPGGRAGRALAAAASGGGAGAAADAAKKGHRQARSGPTAERKKVKEKKKKGVVGQPEKGANPKAFSFKSARRAKLAATHRVELQQKRLHAPVLDRTPEDEPPPYIIVVQGPPKVGKTTLIQSLIKHYTKHNIPDVRGPITVVSGKRRRLQFVECVNDMNAMVDAAKFADLALLLIDASFGFEMETFEYLNMLQVHGFPKVMGVLTHLDTFKDVKRQKKTKKTLKHRFWTEIYDGAKLFYLSGLLHGRYLKREVLNLARFISVAKFRPLRWRMAHAYMLADRVEDLTDGETIRADPTANRTVALYGYLRGTNFKPGTKVHIAGVGDADVDIVTALPDPCPLPSELKKRSLNEKEKLLYAPMANIGDMMYDRDAVYINIADHQVQYSKKEEGAGDGKEERTRGGDGDGDSSESEDGEHAGELSELQHKPTAREDAVGEEMVRSLQTAQVAVDEKLESSSIVIFGKGRGKAAADSLPAATGTVDAGGIDAARNGEDEGKEVEEG